VTQRLRVRRLGTVDYADACSLQEQLHARHGESWLLLLEHEHVYTLGVRAKREHVLVVPECASLTTTNRGGDVTYHGPGQLVGYPILDVPFAPDAVPAHVHRVEQVLIDALHQLGCAAASRAPGFPGVWIEDRKIAAIGIRVARGRSMHGFALNVCPDLGMFEHIVPCGIRGRAVTSLEAEGVSADVERVTDVVARLAGLHWAGGSVDDRRSSAATLHAEVACRP
jgi:lipoic acid synthetase